MDLILEKSLKCQRTSWGKRMTVIGRMSQTRVDQCNSTYICTKFTLNTCRGCIQELVLMLYNKNNCVLRWGSREMLKKHAGSVFVTLLGHSVWCHMLHGIVTLPTPINNWVPLNKCPMPPPLWRTWCYSFRAVSASDIQKRKFAYRDELLTSRFSQLIHSGFGLFKILYIWRYYTTIYIKKTNPPHTNTRGQHNNIKPKKIFPTPTHNAGERVVPSSKVYKIK